MIKSLRKPIFFTITIALIIWGFSILGTELDDALNTPGDPHNEIFLWKYNGYPKDPQLDFKLDLSPEQKIIRVVYMIENKSNRLIEVVNEIEIAVVAADGPVGDPGTLVWRLPKINDKNNITKTELGPNMVFKEELLIDRDQVQTSGQYYINAYYKGDMVTQFKIIEGVYSK